MPRHHLLFDPLPPTLDLSSGIDMLFARQRAEWPLFRDGEASLATIRARRISIDDGDILVQSNPGRRQSIQAATDPQSIAARNCFLCPQHMPAEEQGIGFGTLILYPNPYPILPRHCTIPSREHSPQQIAGQLDTMLELARELGPDMVVFYNGPRCGASAPDHFHFQACQAAGIPLLTQLSHPEMGLTARQIGGRRMFVNRMMDQPAVRDAIERTILALGTAIQSKDEPMLNLIVQHRGDHFVSLLFPRAAHRPACYHKEGARQIAISPAALEMAGILVVADSDQWNRIDGVTAQQIYSEVSLDAELFTTVAKELAI